MYVRNLLYVGNTKKKPFQNITQAVGEANIYLQFI